MEWRTLSDLPAAFVLVESKRHGRWINLRTLVPCTTADLDRLANEGRTILELVDGDFIAW